MEDTELKNVLMGSGGIRRRLEWGDQGGGQHSFQLEHSGGWDSQGAVRGGVDL